MTDGADRRRSVAWPLGVALVAGSATAVLAVRSPYQPGSYGICPSIALFGVWCPACGGLRAVHSLTQGEIASAWAMNPLFVAGVPLLVAAWVAWLGASAGWWRPVRVPPWTAWVFLGIAVGYAVVRNLLGVDPPPT